MVDVRYDVAFKLYPYKKVAEQELAQPKRHQVVIVGGGPVGMALALDLGLKNVPVLLLDDHDGVGQGSRAICFSKRTLEIADRLGAGDAMIDKGVVWHVGKVFHQAHQVFEFNLLAEDNHKQPAFINLQQPYFEKYIFNAIQHARRNAAPIEIRGKNQIVSIERFDDYTLLEVDTPDGIYKLEADWLIACDGAGSPIRKMMGVKFEGHLFEDNFLIADVKMKADFPTERWFWFEPSFKGSSYSALLHKQPDDIWRIDFQLGWDIDRKEELKFENIKSRVDAMLGDDVKWQLEWSSIYTFQCRQIEKFRHGRVLFAGDSAHQVSPFGARGANSGIQDIDNLAWKLKLVLDKKAPTTLLDTYSDERVLAAKENILNSTRSTDFITPKTDISKIFRNAVLKLAVNAPFARPLVNSGRLSLPAIYNGSSLNTADCNLMPERTKVGSPASDVKLDNDWLLNMLGDEFKIVALNIDVPSTITVGGESLKILNLSTDDNIILKQRYLGELNSALYLIRPDQYIAARWQTFDIEKIENAYKIATGNLG